MQDPVFVLSGHFVEQHRQRDSFERVGPLWSNIVNMTRLRAQKPSVSRRSGRASLHCMSAVTVVCDSTGVLSTKSVM